MSVCDLCNCVFTIRDGWTSSPQPWAFLLGHQKEEKETLGEGSNIGRLEKAHCLPQLALPLLKRRR